MAASLFRPAVGLVALLGLATAAVAQDFAALEQAAEEAVTARDAAKAELDAAETELLKQQQLLAKLKAELATAPKTAKATEEELGKQKPNVAKAEEAKTKADAELEAKQKELEAAKGTGNEKAATEAVAKAEEAAKKAAEALDAAKKTVADLEAKLAEAKKIEAEWPRQIEAAEKKLGELQTTADESRKAYAVADATAVEKQRVHETALIDAGKLVSFAKSVAPIFNDRCLACHNARTAKGRFNMESFEAILKGGESGPAIDSESPEFSNLLLLIEDGSMPKDADPLTKEQIATVAKWIETGSRLDAGLDPTAPLVRIMPKQPHPAPPESYRVPIPVTALAFSPDGSLLASSGYHEVLLWDPATGDLVRRVSNVAERVYDVEFAADGKTLAVAAGTPARIGEVRLFDVATGELVRDYVTTTDSVFAVAFSPDGNRLATAGADRAVRVFDVATGEEQLVIEDHADWVMNVAWSPDGSKLASASRDKTSKVFDAKSGDSLVTFNGHGDSVYGVGFSPDGKQVVTTGADKQIRIWNVSDAKQIKNIGGFGGDVFQAVVTKDGHVFTASSDKNARQHELGGKAVRTFSGHADWVYAVAVDPANPRIATAGYDGEIRVWNVADGAVQAQFPAVPGAAGEKATAAK